MLESLHRSENARPTDQRPLIFIFIFNISFFLCLGARILERERVAMRRPESYDLFLRLRNAARGIAAALLSFSYCYAV